MRKPLTSAQRKSQRRARAYPRVIVRAIAAFYFSRPVVLTTSPVSSTEPFDFVLQVPEGTTRDPLPAEVRESLIDLVAEKSRRCKLKMCDVFGKNDVVYAEPEDRRFAATGAPSGDSLEASSR